MRENRAQGRRRVAIVGLGKQGILLLERLGRRDDVDLVAAVDVAADKVGRPLGAVAGLSTPFADVRIADSLDAVAAADVALVATSSRIDEVGPQLERIAALGVHAITTSEEVAYPWHQYPEQSARLDAAAREHGVSVIGCGSNPGFLMDLVPLVFSFGCERVDSIRIRRSLDMRPHRPERLERFALGLTPAEFDRVEPSVLVGHVGFTQSMHCVADAFGWRLEQTREEAVRPAVVTTERRVGDHVTLEPGTVAVIEHCAWAEANGERIIDLAMYFGFHDADDPVEHGDFYEIRASDQSVCVQAEPSWSPFTATPSTVVNMIFGIDAARPGLVTVADLPAGALAARGAAVTATEPLVGRDYLVELAGRRAAATP